MILIGYGMKRGVLIDEGEYKMGDPIGHITINDRGFC